MLGLDLGANALSKQEMAQIVLQKTREHQIRLELVRREFLSIFRAVGTEKYPFWVSRLGPVRTKTALLRRNLSGQKQANLGRLGASLQRDKPGS